MGLQAAKTFILTSLDSAEFRQDIASCKTKKEFEAALMEYEIPFSDFEFEEAFNSLHSLCQSAEQADSLFNIKNWYLLNLSSWK